MYYVCRFTYIVICVSLLLLCNKVYSKETIVFGITVFPPSSIVDTTTGRCTGPAIDATNSIFSETFKVEIFCAPAARIYKLLKVGDIDLTLNIKSTSALEQLVTFYNRPFNQLNIAVYSHADIAFSRTVATIRGFDYQGVRTSLLNDGFKLFDVPSATDTITLFLRRRTSHLVSYVGPFNYFIATSNFEVPFHLEVDYVGRVDTFYGISKASLHHNALLELLSRFGNNMESRYIITSITGKEPRKYNAR